MVEEFHYGMNRTGVVSTEAAARDLWKGIPYLFERFCFWEELGVKYLAQGQVEYLASQAGSLTIHPTVLPLSAMHNINKDSTKHSNCSQILADLRDAHRYATRGSSYDLVPSRLQDT